MLSVAVCTLDRAAKLANCLESLARMRVPEGVAWELIVVDNGSTDGTADLLRDVEARGVLPLRRCLEPRRGLCLARNLAVSIARGDVIAFTDDDCRVSEDWLGVLAEKFAGDSGPWFLGGRVELFNPADRPLAVRTGREPLDLTGTTRAFDVLIGCNMAIRREAFRRVGDFDPRLGPGSAAPAWEETDLIYRLVRLGVPMRYTPDWLIYHDHGRATDAQAEATQYAYMKGRGGFYAKHVLRGDGFMVRMHFWDLRQLLGDLVDRAKCRESLTLLSALLRGFVRYIFPHRT